jgi:hypothetical protein
VQSGPDFDPHRPHYSRVGRPVGGRSASWARCRGVRPVSDLPLVLEMVVLVAM